MKVRGVGFNRAFFNLWFLIAPMAATKWLNFKFDVAEALDNLDRDESGELSDFDVCIILVGMMILIAIASLAFLPSWPLK